MSYLHLNIYNHKIKEISNKKLNAQVLIHGKSLLLL